MKWQTIEERTIKIANYLIATNDTVRNAAKVFGVSKSTVHKDVALRLKDINKDTYEMVRCVLDKNKAERHIRGGMATKDKYKKDKMLKNGRNIN